MLEPGSTEPVGNRDADPTWGSSVPVQYEEAAAAAAAAPQQPEQQQQRGSKAADSSGNSTSKHSNTKVLNAEG